MVRRCSVAGTVLGFGERIVINFNGRASVGDLFGIKKFIFNNSIAEYSEFYQDVNNMSFFVVWMDFLFHYDIGFLFLTLTVKFNEAVLLRKISTFLKGHGTQWKNEDYAAKHKVSPKKFSVYRILLRRNLQNYVLIVFNNREFILPGRLSQRLLFR